MKLGCLGCLFLAVVLLGFGIIIGGGLIFSTLIFNVPDPLPATAWAVSDGHRAQQKMAEVVLRDTLKSSRNDPLVFTGKEINAFLASHLEESERMSFSPLLVSLEPGLVVIQGKTQLKALMRGIPFNYLAQILPSSEANRPVWVVIQGTVRIEHGRVRKEREFFRIEPTGFRMGDLEAGTWFLSWLLGPGLLRWPVPKVIEDVRVEKDRMIVTTQGGLEGTR